MGLTVSKSKHKPRVKLRPGTEIWPGVVIEPPETDQEFLSGHMHAEKVCLSSGSRPYLADAS